MKSKNKNKNQKLNWKSYFKLRWTEEPNWSQIRSHVRSQTENRIESKVKIRLKFYSKANGK